MSHDPHYAESTMCFVGGTGTEPNRTKTRFGVGFWTGLCPCCRFCGRLAAAPPGGSVITLPLHPPCEGRWRDDVLCRRRGCEAGQEGVAFPPLYLVRLLSRTVRILPLQGLYSVAFPQRHFCASSSFTRLLVTIFSFLLSGRSRASPHPKSRSQLFRVVHWVVQVRFRLFFQPPYYSRCFSSSTFRLRDSFHPCFITIPSCPVRPKFTYRYMRLRLPFLLEPSRTSSTTRLSSLPMLFPIQPSSVVAGNLLLWMFSTLYTTILIFSACLCCQWVHFQCFSPFCITLHF